MEHMVQTVQHRHITPNFHYSKWN